MWRAGHPIWLVALSAPLGLRLSGTYATLSGSWSLIAGLLGPLFALSAAIAVVIMMRRGDRRIALLLLLAVNIGLALEDLRFHSSTHHDGLKLMTWNVALGWGDKHRCVQERIAAIEPDIIALQELRQEGSEAIATALNMQCTWSGYFDKPGTNGLAICVPKDWSMGRAGKRRYAKGRSYAFQFAELRPPGGPTFNLMNLHLQSLYLSRRESDRGASTRHLFGHTMARQIWQLFGIMRVATQLTDPLVLAGDFNSTSTTWVHTQLRGAFVDAHRDRGLGFGATRWIAGLLPARIDYLYRSRGLRWTGVTRSVDAGGCSDHRPVVAQMEFAP